MVGSGRLHDLGTEFYRVFPTFPPCFTGFYRVFNDLPSYDGVYWVLPSFIGLMSVVTGPTASVPSFTEFFPTFPPCFTGFYRAFNEFTGFYQVTTVFTGFYRVLLA